MINTIRKNWDTFYIEFEKIDLATAKELQKEGCKFCQCPKLDVANYRCKPKGLLQSDCSQLRFSFCCRQCRRRATPKSLRFLAPTYFGSLFFIFISILIREGESYRLKRLVHHFGISLSTLKRWKYFWEQIFPETCFWKEKKSEVFYFFSNQFNLGQFYFHFKKYFFNDSKETILKTLIQFFTPLNRSYLKVPT